MEITFDSGLSNQAKVALLEEQYDTLVQTYQARLQMIQNKEELTHRSQILYELMEQLKYYKKEEEEIQRKLSDLEGERKRVESKSANLKNKVNIFTGQNSRYQWHYSEGVKAAQKKGIEVIQYFENLADKADDGKNKQTDSQEIYKILLQHKDDHKIIAELHERNIEIQNHVTQLHKVWATFKPIITNYERQINCLKSPGRLQIHDYDNLKVILTREHNIQRQYYLDLIDYFKKNTDDSSTPVYTVLENKKGQNESQKINDRLNTSISKPSSKKQSQQIQVLMEQSNFDEQTSILWPPKMFTT